MLPGVRMRLTRGARENLHRPAVDLQIELGIVGIVGNDELSAVGATIIPERCRLREKRRQG